MSFFICSQALSALLVILTLIRVKDMHHLELRRIRFDNRMLKRIIQIGFPPVLQSVMYSLSNIIIQAAINNLGTDTVAAWTVYGKMDLLFWMTINSFGIAITTFVGCASKTGYLYHYFLLSPLLSGYKHTFCHIPLFL